MITDLNILRINQKIKQTLISDYSCFKHQLTAIISSKKMSSEREDESEREDQEPTPSEKDNVWEIENYTIST